MHEDRNLNTLNGRKERGGSRPPMPRVRRSLRRLPFDVSTPRRFDASRRRAGFTLIESLMAVGLLLGIVIAVTSAITAGQQHAYDAQQRIAGSLAAEELMGRISVEPYARISSWDGFEEEVGELTDINGQALPATLQMVGRDVHISSGMKTIAGLDVRLRGLTVTVRSFARDGRSVASISRFVPEPQS